MPEWRFSYINRAAETYFGVPRQAMLHRMIWDVFPDSEGTDLRRRYEEVFASGAAAVLRVGIRRTPGALPGIPRLSL